MKLTILNASGQVVFNLFTAAGEVASAPSVLLTPGAYTIRYTVVAPAGSSVPTLTFNLSGSTISEPIGPTIKNPTLTPIYSNPTIPGSYLYPTGVTTSVPYYIGAVRA